MESQQTPSQKIKALARKCAATTTLTKTSMSTPIVSMPSISTIDPVVVPIEIITAEDISILVLIITNSQQVTLENISMVMDIELHLATKLDGMNEKMNVVMERLDSLIHCIGDGTTNDVRRHQSLLPQCNSSSSKVVTVNIEKISKCNQNVEGFKALKEKLKGGDVVAQDVNIYQV